MSGGVECQARDDDRNKDRKNIISRLLPAAVARGAMPRHSYRFLGRPGGG